MPSFISIGVVRTSFGVKGWMKLSSHSGEWEHFANLESVVFERPGGSLSVPYTVEGFRMHHGGGILKLVGIDDPETAKGFSRSEILVDREFRAPLGDDEWYLSDLVGLALLTESGESIGEVVSVIESSDDLLEIRRPDSSLVLIPFRKDFVEEPDLDEGTMVLTAEWLVED